MNLLLVQPHELIEPTEAIIYNTTKIKHLQQHVRCIAGDTLKVGIAGGLKGRAIIKQINTNHLHLTNLELNTLPPAKLNLNVLLALPRPKAIKRLLQDLTTLGCQKVILCNAARVEKSYWQTPFLQPAIIKENIEIGLEQSGDTIYPEVILQKRLKPFVEDELGSISSAYANMNKLLAHPYSHTSIAALNMDSSQETLLAIGPEGGWVPFELELFEKAGFTDFSLGPRILRTETAINVVIGNLFNSY